MIATHDSMRLRRVSERGFTLWKAVEVTLSSPLYLMTMRHGSDTDLLALLFSNDQDLVSFLTDNAQATPVSLDVIAPRQAAMTTPSRLVAVRALSLHNSDSTAESMLLLRLTNGQTVRARDLAPREPAANEPLLLIEFPGAESR